MPVHIGKKIKEEVYKQRISVTLFARKISRSRNVVYDIFRRESVDTDLLNKIGKILNCDFFSLYSAQKEYAQEGIKTFYVRDSEGPYGRAQDENMLLQQNQALKEEVAYLKKIVALVENRKPRPSKKIKKIR